MDLDNAVLKSKYHEKMLLLLGEPCSSSEHPPKDMGKDSNCHGTSLWIAGQGIAIPNQFRRGSVFPEEDRPFFCSEFTLGWALKNRYMRSAPQMDCLFLIEQMDESLDGWEYNCLAHSGIYLGKYAFEQKNKDGLFRVIPFEQVLKEYCISLNEIKFYAPRLK